MFEKYMDLVISSQVLLEIVGKVHRLSKAVNTKMVLTNVTNYDII